MRGFYILPPGVVAGLLIVTVIISLRWTVAKPSAANKDLAEAKMETSTTEPKDDEAKPVYFQFRNPLGQLTHCKRLMDITPCGAFIVECDDERKHFCVTNVSEIEGKAP